MQVPPPCPASKRAARLSDSFVLGKKDMEPEVKKKYTYKYACAFYRKNTIAFGMDD